MSSTFLGVPIRRRAKDEELPLRGTESFPKAAGEETVRRLLDARRAV